MCPEVQHAWKFQPSDSDLKFCLFSSLSKFFTSSGKNLNAYRQYFWLLLILVLLFVCLQLEQLYSLSLCSREDCLKILSRYQWNLQVASRYLIRWSRDDRSGPGERERPQMSTERRVWRDQSNGFYLCYGMDEWLSQQHPALHWHTLAQEAAYRPLWCVNGRGRSCVYKSSKMKMGELKRKIFLNTRT